MFESIMRSDASRTSTAEETDAAERDDAVPRSAAEDAGRSASESNDPPRIVLGADQRDVWLAPGSGKVLGVN